MTDNKKTQDTSSLTPDLSVLAEFQFGPSWAREDAKKEYSSHDSARRSERPRRDTRREGRFPQRDGQPRREFGERRDNRERGRGDFGSRPERRNGRFDRNDRERAPLPEPVSGLRVELRPVDLGLAACAAEVSKHKRVVSLFDFAKVIMGKRDRYDLVFMKQEGGPELYCSGKGDHACWLTRGEAVKYIWKAAWFDEFYEAMTEDAEPPKGEFSAIGKCVFSNELIGPVNWHGYQSALINLHKTKYSNMPFDRFKSKIQIEKGDEVVQAWLDSVSKKTVWKPRREGAGDVVLSDVAAVEKDFEEHHFDDVYTLTDKVFINGSVARHVVSPGIWAHIATLADVTRKHPSMLIPNICHGLARHHMPIFKWKGGHHTGPSRPRMLTTDTVLADRLMAIINWVQRNTGKRVDLLLKELCDSGAVGSAPEEKEAPLASEQIEPSGVAEPAAADQEPQAESAELSESTETAEVATTPEPSVPVLSDADARRQELVKDLFWLCDQGYVLVFADGKICLPKSGDSPRKDEAAGKGKAPSRQKTGKQKVKKDASEIPSAPIPEQPARETADEPVSAESGPERAKAECADMPENPSEREPEGEVPAITVE